MYDSTPAPTVSTSIGFTAELRIIAFVLLLLLHAGSAHASSARDDCTSAREVVDLAAAATFLPGAVLHAQETTTWTALERGTRVRSGVRRGGTPVHFAASATAITLRPCPASTDERARFAPTSLALRTRLAAWLTTRPPPVFQH